MANKTEQSAAAISAQTVTPTKKTRGRPFTKGTSGNPSGRPKTPTDVQQLLKERAPDLVQALIDMALNKRVKPETRLKALTHALDRALGKVAEPQTQSPQGTSELLAAFLGALAGQPPKEFP